MAMNYVATLTLDCSTDADLLTSACMVCKLVTTPGCSCFRPDSWHDLHVSQGVKKLIPSASICWVCMDSTLFRWGAVAWWWVGPNPPQAMQFWVTAWIGWVKCTMVHCPSPMQYGSLPLMLFWVWVTASHAILGHCLPCCAGSLPVRKTSFVTAVLLSQPINPQMWTEVRFSSSTYFKNESTFVCSALGDSKS